ncbi:diguanylate cyclase domain-containing protein [Caballeronia telluris]
MDFDRFNDINDSSGHAAGDEVLRAIGERLHACRTRACFAHRR